MFCYQCEQTEHKTGCTTIGVCGKTPAVASLQDALVHITKGLSCIAHAARTLGLKDVEVDRFVLEATFSVSTGGMRNAAELHAGPRKQPCCNLTTAATPARSCRR